MTQCLEKSPSSAAHAEYQHAAARCALATEVGDLPQLVGVERERRERKYRKKIARQARRDAAAAAAGQDAGGAGVP